MEVPGINIHKLQNKSILLSYRTEFHNGTENGCLRVFNRIEDNKLIPFFVLEELFYISKEEYYYRIVKQNLYDLIEYDLYVVKEKKRKKLLTVVLKKDNNRFEIELLHEFQKGFYEHSLFFSDVYEKLRNKILNNRY